MNATAVHGRSLLPGPTWPPSAPPSPYFPLTRRSAVLADDPCEAGFSGADPEYAGIYLHARYFDPRLGTFLSPDPIGVAGGMNEYGYGFGNPIGFSDRTGLLADANGCDGGAGVPYIVDGMWYFPSGVGCPGGGGGGGGGGASSWMPGHAPSTGPVVGSPSSTYPPDDGYGGHGTPVCKPGDPNCAKTECKPGDPNCDKTACKPGDPGCEEQPPACQPGDPGCTAGPEPERPKNAHTPEQPFPFRDPCTTGFWGRFEDSFGYLEHQTVGRIPGYEHLAEASWIVGTTVVSGVLFSQSVRTGVWYPATFEFGQAGMWTASGRIATFAHRATPYGFAAFGALAGSAAYDAARADNYCR